MQSTIRFFLALTFLSLLFCGCSGGGIDTPITPSDPVNELLQTTQDTPLISESDMPASIREMSVPDILDFAIVGGTFQLLGTLGGFQLTLDSSLMTAELISLRQSSIGESYLVNGAAFFTIQPCSDCLKIQSLQLTPDNLLKVNFAISHPFDKGDPTKPPTAMNRLDLDVFDLALVVVPSNHQATSFPLTAAQAYDDLCANADGFTREIRNITGNNPACPYFLVVDNSDSGTSTYNRFAMGTKNQAFSAYFKGDGIFELYLTMGYGASAKKKTRLTPTYYLPEFNRKCAWKVDVIPPQGENTPAIGNTWDNVDIEIPYEVTVKVRDWQQSAIVAPQFPDSNHKDWIYKSSKVSRVTVEVPGMTHNLPSATNPESGTGTPSNPLIYKISFANDNGLAPGDYTGLVKVSDERVPPTTPTPGATDSLVHTRDGVTLEWRSIAEFTTYQLFTATIVQGRTITVDSPNGDETWYYRLPYEVKWNTVGPIPNVNIDLSIDSGVSYTVPIAADAPNSGSYDITSLGNHPSEHARIRISMSGLPEIRDESDDDFTIICPSPSPPTNINATDGNYSNRVAVSWTPAPTATSYNIYRDNNLIEANFVGNTYTDYDVVMGVVYHYQVESNDECGTGDKAPAAPGEPGNACVLPPPPASVTASDGTYSDHVAISWSSVTGATSYNLYRDSSLLQSGIVGTSYNDNTAARGVLYDYEVETVDSCGPSQTKTLNTGYALGCTPDDNDTCTKANYVYRNSVINNCVDQIDEDWFHFYVSPNGFTSSSTIVLSIPSGTVNIDVYAFDPGGSCPGTLQSSVQNTGSTTINMSASSLSHVYVHLEGASGMVNYTMTLNFIPVVTNVPIEIYVATTDGTGSGTWPTAGSTPLTHQTLIDMRNWANNFWNIYGYNFVWDETENFMLVDYYTLNYAEEDFVMHDYYGRGTDKLSLYFVDQLWWGNTAYCWVYDPPSDHNVDNVFTVYSPNVWSWQNVIAHEEGHGIGYLNDEYLYPMYGCPCGDNVCLAAAMDESIYLFSVTNGCYAGNQMYYAYPSNQWDFYNFVTAQWNWVHEFNFVNFINFPWY